MLTHKGATTFRHAFKPRLVGQQIARGGQRGNRAVDLYRRTGGHRKSHGLGKVVIMRPHHHRLAERTGLDQVVSALRQGTAADDGNITSGKMGGHLADLQVVDMHPWRSRNRGADVDDGDPPFFPGHQLFF